MKPFIWALIGIFAVLLILFPRITKRRLKSAPARTENFVNKTFYISQQKESYLKQGYSDKEATKKAKFDYVRNYSSFSQQLQQNTTK